MGVPFTLLIDNPPIRFCMSNDKPPIPFEELSSMLEWKFKKCFGIQFLHNKKGTMVFQFELYLNRNILSILFALKVQYQNKFQLISNSLWLFTNAQTKRTIHSECYEKRRWLTYTDWGRGRFAGLLLLAYWMLFELSSRLYACPFGICCKFGTEDDKFLFAVKFVLGPKKRKT